MFPIVFSETLVNNGSPMLCIFVQAIELESQELELDLSSLGAVNTMFAALFR